MRSRDIFGLLRLRLRLRGSVPAPAPVPAPSKTFRRLRLRLRLRCPSPHMSLNQQYDFQKCQYQNMTSYWLDLEFECYFEWVSLKFVTHCHPRSVADTGEVTGSRSCAVAFRSRSCPVFDGSGSGSGSEQTASAAPAPAPTKMRRLQRLWLRLRLRLRIPDFALACSVTWWYSPMQTPRTVI